VTAQRALVAIIALVGVLAIVVGVIYFADEAKSLPSVLGQIHGDTAHRTLRGIIALVVGGVLLFGSVGFAAYGPRRPR
jgi:ribose/xylose/arabinose/galactoside ABC-type transport system permease subunit